MKETQKAVILLKPFSMQYLTMLRDVKLGLDVFLGNVVNVLTAIQSHVLFQARTARKWSLNVGLIMNITLIVRQLIQNVDLELIL